MCSHSCINILSASKWQGLSNGGKNKKTQNVLELPTKPTKALDQKLTLKLFRSFLVLRMGAIIQNVAILKVEKTPINTLNHHRHHHHHLALLFGTHHTTQKQTNYGFQNTKKHPKIPCWISKPENNSLQPKGIHDDDSCDNAGHTISMMG